MAHKNVHGFLLQSAVLPTRRKGAILWGSSRRDDSNSSEGTSTGSRYVGLILNNKGLFIVYNTLDKLMRFPEHPEMTLLNGLTSVLNDCGSFGTQDRKGALRNISAIVIGKSDAMLPKIYRGTKWGVADNQRVPNPVTKNLLSFYIYVYSVLKISCKRDGDAPAVEAVRAADALMRHPMTPEMLEQRIAGLRASVRYDRTSVSKKRVISDLQITVAEQKQLKRLLGHEEDLRRKSKSGMLRSERDTALDTAIVEMLAQGKLHREIGEKLGMARESVTRRIRRNNLLREVQEARNALAKEQARAKKAEKTKNKDDDDKNGGARAGGTQAASKPQKKSSRKPLSESRWLAVLAVQRVRRAKERLARKCSICIRNLAKRYYRLNAARVEWISGVSAAKSLCATPFPQLC